MELNKIRKKINQAKQSSQSLLILTAMKRKKVLFALAACLEKNTIKILSHNKEDVVWAQKAGKASSFIERLSLSQGNIRAMAKATREIARAEDKLFKVVSQAKRPSGINIKKTIFPLGLVTVIYESRPNVTIDAFSLCFKSGNSVILKGGKEITNTNSILVGLIKEVLKKEKINTEIIQDFSGIKKELLKELLENKQIDCLIPRGGKGLIEFVSQNAKVPVIVTGASVVHIYIDKSADLKMAVEVIVNAKTRRVSICNALDVVVIHKDVLNNFFALAIKRFSQKKIELIADEAAFGVLKELRYSKIKKAKKSDFDCEFLDCVLAVKTVNNFKEAVSHIQEHSLGHSEAIITRSVKQKEEFFRYVDAACLYHNTSTQFSDGGEYGMGGEIGISTQKLHARGPFAYRELTTHKFLVNSKGAIRE